MLVLRLVSCWKCRVAVCIRILCTPVLAMLMIRVMSWNIALLVLCREEVVRLFYMIALLGCRQCPIRWYVLWWLLINLCKCTRLRPILLGRAILCYAARSSLCLEWFSSLYRVVPIRRNALLSLTSVRLTGVRLTVAWNTLLSCVRLLCVLRVVSTLCIWII